MKTQQTLLSGEGPAGIVKCGTPISYPRWKPVYCISRAILGDPRHHLTPEIHPLWLGYDAMTCSLASPVYWPEWRHKISHQIVWCERICLKQSTKNTATCLVETWNGIRTELVAWVPEGHGTNALKEAILAQMRNTVRHSWFFIRNAASLRWTSSHWPWNLNPFQIFKIFKWVCRACRALYVGPSRACRAWAAQLNSKLLWGQVTDRGFALVFTATITLSDIATVKASRRRGAVRCGGVEAWSVGIDWINVNIDV